MKKIRIISTETYPEYMLIVIQDIVENRMHKRHVFELESLNAVLSEEDICVIANLLRKGTTIGLGTLHYDLPLIHLALNNMSSLTINTYAKKVKTQEITAAQALRQHNIAIDNKNHIDLMGVVPFNHKNIALYGARTHHKRLVVLPESVGKNTCNIEKIKDHCFENISILNNILNKYDDGIQMRETLSTYFNVEARSFTNGNIFNLLLPKEKNDSQKYMENKSFTYKSPSYLKFRHKSVNVFLSKIRKNIFYTSNREPTTLPKWCKNYDITIGEESYKITKDGLNSCKRNFKHTSHKKQLVNVTMKNYYQSIIRIIIPESDIIKNNYDSFLKSGNVNIAKCLKIVLDNMYTKLSSKDSVFFDPRFAIDALIDGQLYMLFMIDTLEKNGIKVVFANKDNIVASVSDKSKKTFDDCVGFVSTKTDISFHINPLDSLHCFDSQNYIKQCGDRLLCKGLYEYSNCQKDATGDICITAAREFIKNNVPVEDTIRKSKNIKDFIFVANAKKGCKFQDTYMGTIARWIYTEQGANIRSIHTGKEMENANKCTPIMTIDESIQISEYNIDYARYEFIANNLLMDCGAIQYENIKFI